MTNAKQQSLKVQVAQQAVQIPERFALRWIPGSVAANDRLFRNGRRVRNARLSQHRDRARELAKWVAYVCRSARRVSA